ncbi:non-ribosomal peptide synthetase [Haliangium ochraceum]|uniref:Amino acid adenylation domain protein n=1 Tax=Haliangium ochraceum (strain DSM 14365 / JCM 11303 / SMP-2) TaxID=502025 RepID=D0LXU3_HALO1|nr:non-ribosomal peptide synthetase [Haliangium ochraceum]ACY14298.1 amino acid adenylation domain protein [Haliangium ochraceum DSM 14365]
MTPIVSLLSQLRERDIRVWLDGERVRLDAPAGALSDELRIALKARRDELIAFLRQAEKARTGADERIEPAPRTGPLPLSIAQQRLWIIEQFDDTHGAYHLPAALRLEGPCDIDALRACLDALVARHEILRTVFPRRGGKPVQVVRDPQGLPLPIIELAHGAEQPAEAFVTHAEQIRRHAAEEAARPFDLQREPPLRASLLRLGAEAHVLLLTLHHIAGDAHSVDQISRELSELYRAHVTGQAVDLPALPVQYADYAHWEADRAQRGAFDADLDYWQTRLAEAPALIELPTDHARTPAARFRGDAVELAVPAPLLRSLRALADESGATLFMTLLAGYGVLLARHSGQSDVVIGTPVANRDDQTEHLVGLFVNTLPLRVSADMERGFRTLLASVRATTLEDFAHREVPLAELVARIQPERDPSYNPLFQVTFDLQQRPPAEALDLAGLSLSLLDSAEASTQFDLVLSLTPHAGGLQGAFHYQRDLFERATIERLRDHFLTLLAAIAAEPERALATLPLMAEEEREALLASCRPQASFANPACLHERFAAQAQRRPEAVALVCEGTQLSYGELHRRANRLAHRLQALGVAPEVRVGLCIERSLDMLVAILGTLQAGGAYVPLDPDYPPERVGFCVADSGIKHLITRTAERGKLGDIDELDGVHEIILDREVDELAALPDTAPPCAATADSLAYVIYTSGSTGTPKGVQVTHKNVTRLHDATADTYGFHDGDVWPLFHSYAFDVSVWEIWGALLHGGRLVIVPWLVTRSPVDFYRLLADTGATVLNQTPSAFRQFVHADQQLGDDAPALSLRYVIFAGEALEPASLQPWVARHGLEAPRLINMYGITETTVHSTIRELRAADLVRTKSPIGRPIPDLGLYLLDEHGQPVPAGVSGEIYVGGAGVARGYLERPELTAARFLADPFVADADARMYRSGDLARWTHDGDLEYLGRNDAQVKIRGFRIELGEIESRLGAHPDIRVAAVQPWSRGADGQSEQLVAYVVPSAADIVPDPVALRQHLRGALPDYMIPAAFVVLDALPLTPSGKLARRALPAPEQAGQVAAPERQGPRTPLESELVAIWREVLGPVSVGVLDSFFDLGGHSLSALQILARIQERYDVELPMRGFFERSSIEQVAESLTAALSEASASEAAPGSDAASALAAAPAPSETTSAPASTPPRLTRRSREARRVRAVRPPADSSDS